MSSCTSCDDPRGLLRRLDRVPLVVDLHDVQPGFEAVEPAGTGDGLVGVQPAVVGEDGDPLAQRAVHPPGLLQEVAALRRKGGVSLVQPAERRLVDGFGVGALADLRQLLRVAEQQQPLRGDRHGEGVRQGELAGLVDHEQVELAPPDPVEVGEVPRGATDEAAVAHGRRGSRRGRRPCAARSTAGRRCAWAACRPAPRAGPRRPRRRGSARRRRATGPPRRRASRARRGSSPRGRRRRSCPCRVGPARRRRSGRGRRRPR